MLTRDTLALIAKSEAAVGRPQPQVEDTKMLKDKHEALAASLANPDLGIPAKPSSASLDVKTTAPLLPSK